MYGFRDFPSRLDGDIPAIIFQRYRDVPYFSKNLPALPVSHPADLWKIYPGIFLIELISLGITKTIPDPLFVEPGISSSSLEEVFVGSIQILEGLLKNLGMGILQKGGRRIPLPFLQQPREGTVAQALFFVLPGSFFENQGLVPHEAAASGKTPHGLFLFPIRTKTKFEPLKYFHIFIIPYLQKPSPYIPALNDGVLRRQG